MGHPGSFGTRRSGLIRGVATFHVFRLEGVHLETAECSMSLKFH